MTAPELKITEDVLGRLRTSAAQAHVQLGATTDAAGQAAGAVGFAALQSKLERLSAAWSYHRKALIDEVGELSADVTSAYEQFDALDSDISTKLGGPGSREGSQVVAPPNSAPGPTGPSSAAAPPLAAPPLAGEAAQGPAVASPADGVPDSPLGTVSPDGEHVTDPLVGADPSDGSAGELWGRVSGSGEGSGSLDAGGPGGGAVGMVGGLVGGAVGGAGLGGGRGTSAGGRRAGEPGQPGTGESYAGGLGGPGGFSGAGPTGLGGAAAPPVPTDDLPVDPLEAGSTSAGLPVGTVLSGLVDGVGLGGVADAVGDVLDTAGKVVSNNPAASGAAMSGAMMGGMAAMGASGGQARGQDSGRDLSDDERVRRAREALDALRGSNRDEAKP